MDLSIIIVNYKCRKKTIACVDSIYASDLDGLKFEIIVVDNASGDDTEDVLRSRHPSVRFIQSGANLGMGTGNNLGIKQSTGRFVLVLNPDTIAGKESIRELYGHMDKDPKIGIVGPKLVNPDGTLQYSCYRFPKIYTFIFRRTFFWRLGFARAHVDRFLMMDYDRKSPKAVGWIMGSCLLMRREMLDRIGLFDERFFMYLEDTDLCRRSWEAGFKVVFDPQSVIVHDHGRASAGQKWYVAIIKNRMAWVHISSWVKYFLKWGLT